MSEEDIEQSPLIKAMEQSRDAVLEHCDSMVMITSYSEGNETCMVWARGGNIHTQIGMLHRMIHIIQNDEDGKTFSIGNSNE